jgi:hypothetical protein
MTALEDDPELELLGPESYATTLAAYGLTPGDPHSAAYVARLMKVPQHAAQLKPYAARLREDKLL